MSGLWKAIGTLLLTVLGSLLVILLQEPVKGFFNSRVVSASLYAAPWYPREGVSDNTTLLGDPQIPMGKLVKPITDTFPVLWNQEQSNSAKVIITNKTGIKSDKFILDTRKIGLDVQAVAIRRQPTDADIVYPDAKRINIPPLDPGDQQVIYLWSGADFSNQANLDDIHLYGGGGEIKLRVKVSADTQGDIGGFVMSVIGWVLVFLLVALSALMYVVAKSFEKYLKRIMGSESFYIDEKIRYEANPKKFTLPTN